MATAEVRPKQPAAEKHHKFSFPSAFTVLFLVTVLVWLLAFIIPTGAYKTDPGRTADPGDVSHRRRRSDVR